MSSGVSRKRSARRRKRKRSNRGKKKVKTLLENVPTVDLVRELTRREGVKTTTAEPYQDVRIEVSGPAVVLEVID